MAENNSRTTAEHAEGSKHFKPEGFFLACVGGLSALVGFCSAVAASKRKDAASFEQGLSRSAAMAESGVSLATRALAWGTVYAVGGVGAICFVIWKLSGARDLKDFRAIAGSALPRLSKTEPPAGRTEFEGLTDLLEYIIKESENKKPKCP